MKEYYGWYYMLGMVFEVKLDHDELVAMVPYVPPGYEIVLQSVGDDIFRMQGGPLDGGQMRFRRNSSGEVVSIQAEEFELARIPAETAEELPIVERFQAPAFELTEKKASDFTDLLGAVLERQDGGWIDYDLPYPKHEFIQYLTDQDQLIFHGSNHMDIELFEPVRKSIELRDNSGRGNVQGVYGTQDGLWAMFFAIVDRSRLRGSIRNGVMYFQERRSEDPSETSRLAVYNFSINQEQLAEQPYTAGALYLFPRTNFTRLRMGNSDSNEWVSELPVSPIARLKIEPADFPFLSQISGHDDSELIQWGTLGQRVRECAVAANLQADQLTIQLPYTADMSQLVEEFTRLNRVFVPAVRINVLPGAESLALVLDHLPPAYRQTLSESYRDLLRTDQAE